MEPAGNSLDSQQWIIAPTEPLFVKEVADYANTLYSPRGIPPMTTKTVDVPGPGQFPLKLVFFSDKHPHEHMLDGPEECVATGVTNLHTFNLSPHKIPYSDESTQATIWQPFSEHRRCARTCVTHQLIVGNPSRASYGQAAFLRDGSFTFIERVNFEDEEIKGGPCAVDAVDKPATDDPVTENLFSENPVSKKPASDLATPKPSDFSSKLPKKLATRLQKVANWRLTLPTLFHGPEDGPHVDSDRQVRKALQQSRAASHKSEASTPVQENPTTRYDIDKAELLSMYKDTGLIKTNNMVDPAKSEFRHFSALPVELQMDIIDIYIEDTAVAVLLRPENMDMLWAHLGALIDVEVCRNAAIERLVSEIRRLRECMALGTTWYLTIGKFLLANPVIDTSAGATYLKKLQENLQSRRFDRCRKKVYNVWADTEIDYTEAGYEHVPEYYDWLRRGKKEEEDITVKSSFTEPAFQSTPNLLVIAPAFWNVRSNRETPGGVTSDSGWGNAWMIQDAIRAYPSVSKMVISVGCGGDYSWLLPSAGLNLAFLTHLHLDIPLPKHAQPGTPSLERFKSANCPPIPGITVHRPNLVPSFHLCPLLESLADTLEVLSMHGQGAHICGRLFKIPWKKIQIIAASLNSDNGIWCNGAHQSVREDAYRLALRLPTVIYDIQIHIPSDNEHTARPYLWGGFKQQSLGNFMPELASGAQTCCLSCAWRMPCGDPHKNAEGNTIEMGALLAMDSFRESASLSAWLRELSFLRSFHQIDPLQDVKCHGGDPKCIELRVDRTSRVESFMDTCRAPDGPPCGIRRERNQKVIDPRGLTMADPRHRVVYWLINKSCIAPEGTTTPRQILPCRLKRVREEAKRMRDEARHKLGFKARKH